MSNKRVKGEQLYMFIEHGNAWQPIGCSTDCSLNLTAEAIEVSKKGQGGWRRFRPGTKQWNMDCAGFYMESVLPTNFVVGVNAIGQTIRVAMSVLESSLVEAGINLSAVTPNDTHTVVGDAVITSCEYSGSRGGLSTYRISVQGSGELIPIL